MNIKEMRWVVDQCRFPEYDLRLDETDFGEVYVFGVYVEDDVHTGQPATQTTRRWLLSPEMNRSEIVRTVFKCLMTSAEHRTREAFRYRGRTIFMPHYDVDLLWSLVEEASDRKGQTEQ